MVKYSKIDLKNTLEILRIRKREATTEEQLEYINEVMAELEKEIKK